MTPDQIDKHLIKLAKKEIKEWERFIKIVEKCIADRKAEKQNTKKK